LSETTFAGTTVADTLQTEHDTFLKARESYIELQQTYQSTTKETGRLQQTAVALEQEASEAKAAWKALAQAPRTEQRKINAEIERSIELKSNAEKLQRTVEAKQELHHQLISQMAQARFNLNAKGRHVNSLYCQHRLEELLSNSAWVETAGEVLAVSNRVLINERERYESFERQAEPLGPAIAGGYTQAALVNFARLVLAEAMKAGHKTQTALVTVPAAVSGEVVAQNPVALKKLIANGGEIPDEIGSRGENYGPTKGLKVA